MPAHYVKIPDGIPVLPMKCASKLLFTPTSGIQ